MPKEPPKRPPVRIILKKPEEKSQFETNNKLPKREIVSPLLSDKPGSYETAQATPTTMAASLAAQGATITEHQSSRPRDASIEAATTTEKSQRSSDSTGPSLLRLFVKAYAPRPTQNSTRDRGRDGLER